MTGKPIWLRIAGALLPLLFCAMAWSKQPVAKLIFASDMPVIGDINNGNYPQLATLLADNRNKPMPTFFLFGGGSLGPSPMAMFDRGSHIIDILNSLEPDVMGVNKREFSYFEDELSLRAYEAAFPIIASNLFDPLTQGNLDGLTHSAIIEKSGLRIGVMSLLDESVITEYLLERVQVKDPQASLLTAAETLRNQNVDLIVLMYSTYFPFVLAYLEQGVIDIAMLSDPHLELANANSVPAHPNSIYLTQPGTAALATLLRAPDQQKLQVEWQPMKLQSVPAQPQIQQQVQAYSHRLERLLGERVGTLTTSMDTTRPVVRARESAFGNLLTDAMRTYAGADVALINGGVIRGEKLYQPNSRLTRRDIAVELPFRSRLQVLELSGSQLRQALENGFSQLEEFKGKFPHVSGIQVQYNSSAPAGQRVEAISIAGAPVEDERRYVLATTDYLASGGDDYAAFKQGRMLNGDDRASPLISDVLINHIRRLQTIAPKIENRLVDNAAGGKAP